VLHVVAEDPQEQQIAQQVEPTAVHEHAGEQRQLDGIGPVLLRDQDPAAIWRGHRDRPDQVAAGRDLSGTALYAYVNSSCPSWNTRNTTA
jgi:hypothetical protein